MGINGGYGEIKVVSTSRIRSGYDGIKVEYSGIKVVY